MGWAMSALASTGTGHSRQHQARLPGAGFPGFRPILPSGRPYAAAIGRRSAEYRVRVDSADLRHRPADLAQRPAAVRRPRPQKLPR